MEMDEIFELIKMIKSEKDYEDILLNESRLRAYIEDNSESIKRTNRQILNAREKCTKQAEANRVIQEQAEKKRGEMLELYDCFQNKKEEYEKNVEIYKMLSDRNKKENIQKMMEQQLNKQDADIHAACQQFYSQKLNFDQCASFMDDLHEKYYNLHLCKFKLDIFKSS